MNSNNIKDYVFTAKVFENDDCIKELYQSHVSMNDKMIHMLQDHRKMITPKELDDIAKIFDSIYEMKLIDEFPENMSDNRTLCSLYEFPITFILHIRDKYICKAGFAIITKVFADALAEYLKGKKCLEIMAGKGVLSKALQDRGIDVIATDDYSWSYFISTSEQWTYVENIDAGNAIKKYKDVDVILVSWMPMEVNSKRLIRLIRRYNPNVEILQIGEGYGGCTSNYKWFDRIEYLEDDDFYNKVAPNLYSWWGIHDHITKVTVSKPWLNNRDEIIDIG